MIRGIAALGFILVLLSLAGTFDYADALDRDAVEKELRALRASVLPLSSPLQCDATVTQGMTSVAMRGPRCYQRSSTKGHQ